jgi:NADH:ubiquinone oxidoreductase subunit 4 (subunit M)
MLSITLVEDRVFEIPFGLDGLNIFFIVLTTLFLFLCSLAISNTKDFRTVKLLNVYISCFFILTLFLLLVFTILDLFFFYICFEAILIPMFLLIGIGGFYYRKILASYYLVLYTIFGSLFLLLGMGFLWFDFGTLHINMLYTFYCSE